MKVFVVLEWDGTPAAVDGGCVLGVFASRDLAEACVAERITTRKGRDWFDVSEHELGRDELMRRLVREMALTRTATEMREDFGPDYERFLTPE